MNKTTHRPEESSHVRAQWDIINDMVISWILNTVWDETVMV